MFEQVFKLTQASTYSMPDDPDAATDIDKKNNAKRKPKDKDGGVTGVDANNDPNGANGVNGNERDSAKQVAGDKAYKAEGFAAILAPVKRV